MKLDYPALLASSIHDMKNSITMILHKLEFLGEQFPQLPKSEEFSRLSREVHRSQHQLMQLLTLYKLNEQRYLLHFDDCNIHDLLEDCVAGHREGFQHRGIDVEIDCPYDLYWSLDRYLISSIIINCLNNCFRFANSRVMLDAAVHQDKLRLQIQDDGMGFPQDVLQESNSLCRGTNSGLGLVFARMIADFHRRDGQSGMVQLGNGGKLPGSCFTLYLP